jgi:hypothetical protein
LLQPALSGQRLDIPVICRLQQQQQRRHAAGRRTPHVCCVILLDELARNFFIKKTMFVLRSWWNNEKDVKTHGNKAAKLESIFSRFAFNYI